MFEGAPEIVIQGITESGETFRPSDWAERLSGMLSVFSDDGYLAYTDGYLAYSPFLKPIMAGGVRCVAIDRELERWDPAAYKFLLQFARDNQLKMRPGRKAKRPDDPATGTAVAEGGVTPRSDS
jgi:hypothetical protein